MSLVENRAFTHPHTLSHPDRHRSRLYFSGVLGEKNWQPGSSLTLPFTHDKTESQIHQMTCPDHLESVHMDTNSPKSLCPLTHTLTGSVCSASLPSEEQSNQGNCRGKELHYSPNNKLQDPTDCKITLFNFRSLLPPKAGKTKWMAAWSEGFKFTTGKTWQDFQNTSSYIPKISTQSLSEKVTAGNSLNSK